MKSKELLSIFTAFFVVVGAPLLATWDRIRVTNLLNKKKDGGSV